LPNLIDKRLQNASPKPAVVLQELLGAIRDEVRGGIAVDGGTNGVRYRI
jgi:hypothetical protein